MQETFRSVGAPLLPQLLPLIQLCQSPDHCETSLVIFTQHGHEMSATEEEDGELGRFWGRENLIRSAKTTEDVFFASSIRSRRSFLLFFLR